MSQRGNNVKPSPVLAGTSVVITAAMYTEHGRYNHTYVAVVRSVKRVTGGWQVMIEPKAPDAAVVVFTWQDAGGFTNSVTEVRVVD